MAVNDSFFNISNNPNLDAADTGIDPATGRVLTNAERKKIFARRSILGKSARQAIAKNTKMSFGGGGALAGTKFGTWMMGASQKALAGQVFTGTKGLAGVLSKVGNFAVQTAAKPFGAVGGALGSTARVGANILTGQSAFAAGPAAGAPVPFSGAALSCLLYTSPSPRDRTRSRMPSSA